MAANCNFEWDPIKARENRNKHGVDFDEAATIFRDSRALCIFDPDRSETEDRWTTMGISEKGIDRSSVVNDLLRGDIKIAEAME